MCCPKNDTTEVTEVNRRHGEIPEYSSRCPRLVDGVLGGYVFVGVWRATLSGNAAAAVLGSTHRLVSANPTASANVMTAAIGWMDAVSTPSTKSSKAIERSTLSTAGR